MCIYIYIYIERERERLESNSVGFHNFNLRIINLRVSNPYKLIVNVFLVRCRISMCQGLGPKKHDEFSEIDRCPFIQDLGSALPEKQVAALKTLRTTIITTITIITTTITFTAITITTIVTTIIPDLSRWQR